MSDTPKRPYTQMFNVASKVVDRLAPNCTRIELAGSLRRRKELCGDIEIVAVPTEALYAQLDSLLSDGKIRHTEPRKRWGDKLRSFLMDASIGAVQVDLFLQPDPATLGINYMIRTGSSEFSHKMVTQRSQGGWCPDRYHVKDALVWFGLLTAPTPEEGDVFKLWGMDYVEPEQRTADYKPVFKGEAKQSAGYSDLPPEAQELPRLLGIAPLPQRPYVASGEMAHDAIRRGNAK